MTRAHLTKVETRLDKLERLFEKLFPEVNLDRILRGGNTDKMKQELERYIARQARSADNWNRTDIEEGIVTNDRNQGYIPHEFLPKDPLRGFDWAEDQDMSNDNERIGFLVTNMNNDGYYGHESPRLSIRKFGINLAPLLATKVSSMNAVPDPYTLCSRNVTSKYVNAYFENFHIYYPLVDRQAFLSFYDNQSGLNCVDQWQILFNTVLAIGAWSIEGDSTNADLFYYSNVKSHLKTKVFETGSITLVIALYLLSRYTDWKQNSNTSYLYQGQALRIAISLGLHRDVPSEGISDAIKERRRSIWTCLYSHEVHLALLDDRPLPYMFFDEQFSISLPSSLDDRNKLTKKPSICIGIIQTYRLFKEFSDSWFVDSKITTSKCLQICQSLDECQKSMPKYLQADEHSSPLTYYLKEHPWISFMRFHLKWEREWLQIYVLRRLLQSESASKVEPKSDLDRSARMLTHITENTISGVSNYLNNHQLTTLSAWYCTFYLFNASLVPLTQICTGTGDKQESLQQLSTCIKLFKKLKDYNSSTCEKYIHILDQLCVGNVTKDFHLPIQNENTELKQHQNRPFVQPSTTPNAYSPSLKEAASFPDLDKFFSSRTQIPTIKVPSQQTQCPTQSIQLSQLSPTFPTTFGASSVLRPASRSSKLSSPPAFLQGNELYRTFPTNVATEGTTDTNATHPFNNEGSFWTDQTAYNALSLTPSMFNTTTMDDVYKFLLDEEDNTPLKNKT